MDMTIGQVEDVLSVGAPTFLELPSERGPARRVKSKLRGWVLGEYMLLDLPMMAEDAAAILKEAPCVVRFVHQGAACGFDSKILDWCDMGLPFFRVAWPKQVKTHHVRQHVRIATSIPCKLAWGDHEELGEIRDLSLGGCGVVTKRFIKEKTPLRLAFTLPDGVPLKDIRAFVSRSRPLAESVWLGCSFVEDSEGKRDPLIFYMTSTLSRMGIQPMADRRVLVLHNEQTNLRPLLKSFEDGGIHVITAQGLVDGFYRLRMAPPGCILLDMDQPDFAVREICKVIRQTPGFEQTPLFLLGDCADSEGLGRECEVEGHFSARDLQQNPQAILEVCLRRMSDAPANPHQLHADREGTCATPSA
jgi:c-di-GMP-binding flagellar brake protein YcgR/CheY-like chemotaxis protein